MTRLLPYVLASLTYLSWSLGDVAIKLAGVEVPPAQAMFFTALFALPVIGLIALFSGARPQDFKTDNKRFLLLLVGFQFLASLFSILSVTRLPLANFYVLFFASSLLSPLFAFLFLKERVARSTLALIVIGFAGCLWAVGGIDLSSTVTFAGLAFGIACAVTYASAEVTARKANFSETHISMILWPALGYLVLSFVWMTLEKAPIDKSVVPYLAANGLTWVLGWWFLIQALHRTIVGELAPLMFLLLPYGLLFDALIWQQAPSLNLIGGSVVIIGAIALLTYKARVQKT